MKAIFNGSEYPHEMIARRQREVWVSITALRMMQEHHGNKYLSFQCCTSEEEQKWHGLAEALTPAVTVIRGSVT